jgi:hypothetical protein
VPIRRIFTRTWRIEQALRNLPSGRYGSLRLDAFLARGPKIGVKTGRNLEAIRKWNAGLAEGTPELGAFHRHCWERHSHERRQV